MAAASCAPASWPAVVPSAVQSPPQLPSVAAAALPPSRRLAAATMMTATAGSWSSRSGSSGRSGRSVIGIRSVRQTCLTTSSLMSASSSPSSTSSSSLPASSSSSCSSVQLAAAATTTTRGPTHSLQADGHAHNHHLLHEHRTVPPLWDLPQESPSSPPPPPPAAIAALSSNPSLLYSPFALHQWQQLSSLPSFRTLPLSPRFSQQRSSRGKSGGVGGEEEGAVVWNWVAETEHLRRVRMTYFDAGTGVQAFNSVCYPRYSLDLPILTIDLLSFGPAKLLCILDWQPIVEEPDKIQAQTTPLASLRSRFPQMYHTMSQRFFNQSESSFFSPHLLLFRSPDGPKAPEVKVPNGELFQLFQGYVSKYHDMLLSAREDNSDSNRNSVASRQREFDAYFEERDPAIKLFHSYFSTEWTESFTKEFLFPSSSS